MRRTLATIGIALAGLGFGVGLGRTSVVASGTPSRVTEQQAPIGLLRVVDDNGSERNCQKDDVTTPTVERSA